MLDEQQLSSHLMGAIAALASAFCWAWAAILFRKLGNTVSATAMNLSKGVIAAIFLLGLLLLMGELTSIASVDPSSIWFLALSGIIGICLGDTLYFVTLVRLGPRITLLMGALIPVVVAITAIIFLGEQIASLAILGLLLTIAGVVLVLWEKAPENVSEIHWRTGIWFGLLFVLLEAIGIVLTKVGVEDVPSVQATFIRQVAAIGGLTFWGLAVGSLLGWMEPLKDPRIRLRVIFAAIIGALLGTWLSVFALKYTYASVAAALNSTSPLFVLPLAAFMMKERISGKAVLGASMAVLGIAGYFLTLSF